ncbi:rRNA maturation RNase YbeY [Blattabacterium cuenoti]|uniref:rRNA maturation RNase YbeY n=1 Tax=Blattabacterium cuenoti TaxID=1653831 RepID=UPI00293BBC01|nr:rRNA maturation RNase YbeY [Blattabacterium cuenoti]
MNNVKMFGISPFIFFSKTKKFNNMINIFYEVKNFRIENESLFIKKMNLISDNEGYNINNINYIFCNDDFILKMNKKYLKKNFYTDVITFNFSMEINSKFSILGDIYISVDRIIENSNKWNEFFLIELKRVMIHGFLHLIGYDDHRIEDRELMNRKENFYLDLLFQLY